MSRYIALVAVVLLLAACASSRKPELDVYARVNQTRPGNIAVTPAGRVIVTNHPLDAPTLRVVEVHSDGSTTPFPSLDWSDGPDSGDVGIQATIGIAADTRGNVWILDMGGGGAPAQLVAWDSNANRLHRRIEIDTTSVVPTSFLQDFALDEQRGKIYIADMTFPPPGVEPRPALVVVDIETGSCRRVLESVSQLMPSDTDVVIGGSVVASPAGPHHLGVNPIAIDPSFEWVYFGTINGNSIFRLPAAKLADPTVGPDELAAAIERYGPKPPSDGIAVDGSGRVFITDIQASAVGVTTPAGYEIVAQHDTLLSWPDGFALGPDGSVYVTQNHLHAHPNLNEGQDETQKPFHILRLRW